MLSLPVAPNNFPIAIDFPNAVKRNASEAGRFHLLIENFLNQEKSKTVVASVEWFFTPVEVANFEATLAKILVPSNAA